VRYARERCAEVEFSAEDASRTDIDFLCQAVRRAVDAGATTINLPDTVGYAMPEEYGPCSRRVIEYLDGANGITLSAHGHNDLGMGVANSLAAIRAGARQLELTINGIGERAGNAALEEVAVVLRVRQATIGLTTNIHLDKLYATSRLLTEITGVAVAPNKAIVGANAFAHEAGIHQDGIIKNPSRMKLSHPKRSASPSGNWCSENIRAATRCARRWLKSGTLPRLKNSMNATAEYPRWPMNRSRCKLVICSRSRTKSCVSEAANQPLRQSEVR